MQIELRNFPGMLAAYENQALLVILNLQLSIYSYRYVFFFPNSRRTSFCSRAAKSNCLLIQLPKETMKLLVYVYVPWGDPDSDQ